MCDDVVNADAYDDELPVFDVVHVVDEIDDVVYSGAAEGVDGPV